MNIKFFVHLIFSDDTVVEFKSFDSAIEWLREYRQSLELNPYGSYDTEFPVEYTIGNLVNESQEVVLGNRLSELQLILSRSSNDGRINS